jgi:nucleotide-binding universal stress UspA family protein
MFSAPDASHDQSAAVTHRRFRRVLVAWDASADAMAALRAAAAVVGDESGHVVALAIVPARPHLEGERGVAGAGSAGAERAERIFELVRGSLAATSRARLSLQIAEGPQVARSICDYADEHGFDLLVLGRHGDGGLLHHRLGHVAEAAAKSSRIPVLLLSAQ